MLRCIDAAQRTAPCPGGIWTFLSMLDLEKFSKVRLCLSDFGTEYSCLCVFVCVCVCVCVFVCLCVCVQLLLHV